MHQHAKKQEVTWVTVNAPPSNVVNVYVDAAGNPTKTVTQGVDPTPQAAAPENNQAAPPAAPAMNTRAPEPEPAPAASPAPENNQPESSSGGGSGFGFTYSVYNPDTTVKSSDQMKKDFDSIKGEGFKVIRLYGVDNHQTKLVLEQAKSHGMKLWAAVFDLTNLNGDLETLIADVGGDWGSIDTVSIGNELVNGGKSSAGEVVAAIGTAKDKLKGAGWSSPVVVTTDTLTATLANPELCNAATYCAVNCHPYFDGNTAAADAGKFVKTQMDTLKSKLSDQNQRIVISETGWPWQGEPNKAAVASVDNQASAIQSIKDAFKSSPSDVYLFNTFNTMWKKSDATQFNAEQWWGFLQGSGGTHGTAPSEA
jgi:exo-beta-1,3-glucanase (GH17 family)